MKKIFLLICTIIFMAQSFSQTAKQKVEPKKYEKPKLVVGIIIDQMRWDYLYRFYDLYKSNGGFKRLMNDGFSCDNTFVPYLPTVTACGHSCVYTGSVPAIHGITGNNFWDNNLNKKIYCVEDNAVSTVGSTTKDAGQMSPKNVWVTTITDELRLATNFHSKTIGISMKDRGAIIPAGHAANAAYWYDGKSGNFISSTYYMKDLPKYMTDFNNKKLTDSFYQKDWNVSLDKSVYEKYCDTDDNLYENNKSLGSAAFPHQLQQFIGNEYSKVLATPYGNDILEQLAKNIITNEQMGKHDVTDFLAVSFSSTDYVGHAFGPNSWELLDTYIRLDAALGDLFDYLDKTVGKGEYTTFLTADHAGAHVPEFLQKHNIPAGRWADGDIKKDLNDFLKTQFNTNYNLINSVEEYDIDLNHALIDSAKTDANAVITALTKYLLKKEEVLQVVDKRHLGDAAIPAKLKEMIANGYNAAHSGELQIIMKTGVMDQGKQGMTHGVWNTYDSHIPLLWYGWGIKHGASSKEVYMTDIAATVAALLHIQMPSGCIGKVIGDVVQ